MSDINGAAGAPHSEPVIEAPAQELSDFDKQLDQFLNHRMDDDGTDAISPEPVVNATPDAQAPKPEVGQDNAPQGASKDAPAATTIEPKVEIDPALVLEMIGMGDNKAKPVGAEPLTATPPSSEPAPTNAAPAADEPFVPFNTDFKLPPQLTSALFEAEDPEVRSKALVSLLSSALNTAVHVMEERIKTFHAPRIMDSYSERQNFVQTQQAFTEDFYSAAPDLREHGQVVARAIQVIGAKNPNMAWVDAKPLVADLARRTVSQITGKQFTPPAPVTPPAAPPAKASDAPFIADGARPAGIGQPTDQNDPAAILADMSSF